MSVIHVNIPKGLEREDLPTRLRFWAGVYKASPPPYPRIVALLEEAASEVELGQRTNLTYRGNG